MYNIRVLRDILGRVLGYLHAEGFLKLINLDIERSIVRHNKHIASMWFFVSRVLFTQKTFLYHTQHLGATHVDIICR